MADKDHPKEGTHLEDAASEPSGVSRRGFLKSAGLATAATVISSSRVDAKQVALDTRDKPIGPTGVVIRFTLNGKAVRKAVDTRTTLAVLLRDQLNLTGTKVVCDRGACGGCTVQLDGKAVNSCMLLAVDVHGRAVTTIEGLQTGTTLHPVQQAFIETDALQCGYCTPGMIISCKSLLDRNKRPTLKEIKHAVSGNLCRCGTYPHVFAAAALAAKRMRGE